MRSLLDFIYRGEVSVDQDRLTGFLKVAESLRIKGLTEVNEEKCDLPSIASSLLSSSGQQQQPPAAPSPAAPPPPPPSLHRIHLGQPSPSSCSSPGANAPANKRCVPSPSSFHPFSGNSNSNDNSDDLSNASSCYNQKRKRGRPRKLSASSETPSGASPEHDLDSENRISTLSLSNLSDSSYGKRNARRPTLNYPYRPPICLRRTRQSSATVSAVRGSAIFVVDPDRASWHGRFSSPFSLFAVAKSQAHTQDSKIRSRRGFIHNFFKKYFRCFYTEKYIYTTVLS